MASVTSLTEAKIQELMAGWVSVAQQQEQLDALIGTLRGEVTSYQSLLTQFTNLTLPEIQALVAANSITTSNLNDVVIPNLQVGLVENAADIADLNTVVLPDLQTQLVTNAQYMVELPHSFTQPEPPVDGADENRPLKVGDRWFDDNNALLEHRWDGVAWVVSGLEVADFTLTAQKFQTSTHMLY